VSIAGNIARNYPSHWIDSLAAHGIGIDGVRRMNEEVTEAEWFLNEADGSRLDHVYGPDGAFDSLGFAQPMARSDRDRFAAYLTDRQPSGLTFSEFRARNPVTVEQAVAAAPNPLFTHLAPEHPSAQIKLARAFRARGSVVSLDPGRLLAEEPAALEALLSVIDVFLPSEGELTRLLPGLPPESALLHLASRTSASLAVKLGARGALVLTPARDACVLVPAFPVSARDPVGAGDAFCGGFAAGFLATRNPVEAAAYGTASASMAVEGFGAIHALGTICAAAELGRRLARILPRTESVR
jgi:ribokinase